jgi:hypothetical protein
MSNRYAVEALWFHSTEKYSGVIPRSVRDEESAFLLKPSISHNSRFLAPLGMTPDVEIFSPKG